LEHRLVPSGGSISGRLYTDINGNGSSDTGQPGLANWTVFLDTNNNGVPDPGEPSTTTDSSGNYSFSGLAAGTYHVREVLPPNWQQTTPVQDPVVATGQNVQHVNIGNFQQPTISGEVFQDTNGNATLDSGEPGISGWTVFLDTNRNGKLDPGEPSTTTDANGNYSFPNLGPGKYDVREVVPSGWTATTPPPAEIALQSGVDNLGVNFGNFQNISISGEAYQDTNGNGVKDAGEPGLKTWGVLLDFIGSDGKVRATISARTDDNGNYTFPNLTAGTYQVRETALPTWVQTSAAPAPVVAQSGVNVSGVDLGNFQLVLLSGRTYDDHSNNGSDDRVADPGLPGIKVELYQDTPGTGVFDPNADTLVGSTTTPAGGPLIAGQFAFSNIGPGQYFVREVQTSDIRQTSPAPPGVYVIQTQSGTAVTKLDFGNLASPDRIFVDQVYQDLLHRHVDGSSLNTWAGQLDDGTLTRASLVQQVMNSQEYHTDVVQDLYTSVLRRSADQAGINNWTDFLAKGGTAKQVQAFLYGSGEYLNTQGGGTTDGFLKALYLDILNRPIDQAGLQFWRQALATGTPNYVVALTILKSTEAEQEQVQGLYVQYLHRQADAGGLAGMTASLQGGASVEQLVVGLISSPEYAQNSGGDPNQRYVAHLFHDILGRDADADGLAHFTNALNNGTATRTQVAQALLGSSEYQTLVVKQLYTTYLHRDADAGGLKNFTDFLAKGGADEQVAAQLAGSSEYFQQRGGGTNDGFLDAFYKDALARAVDDTGRKAWDQQLQSGTTPGQVAAQIFAGTEYRTNLVQGLYQQYVHRIADARGLSQFLNSLQAGAHDEAIIASLVISGEYFAAS
jgi:hypothetical protein